MDCLGQIVLKPPNLAQMSTKRYLIDFDVNKVNTTPEIRNNMIRKYFSVEPRDDPHLLKFFTLVVAEMTFKVVVTAS